MKILFVLPYVPSLIRVRPYNFIRELAKRHEVSMLASVLGAETSDCAELRPLCKRIEVFPVSRTTSIRNCVGAAITGRPLQSAVSQQPQLVRRVRELLATEPFDIVHVEHLRAAHIVSVIPRGIPTLWDSVDSISLLLERTERQSHSRRQRLLARLELSRTRSYEASLLTKFDRVIVTSPDDAAALEALQPARDVGIVTNGVDLNNSRSTVQPPEPETLVISGKMSYHANVSAVLHFVRDVLPLIVRTRPNVRLRIVGSNPPAVILSLAREPGISVTGYVADMRAALESATVAVCPVTVKVGVQNKLLEAMSASIPVVSTRLGVQGLSVQAGRDLLVADTDEEFANHVCQLLADGHLRTAIGQAGRRFVEANHSWENVVRLLETQYGVAIANQEKAEISNAQCTSTAAR